jgi:hypothetical protein
MRILHVIMFLALVAVGEAFFTQGAVLRSGLASMKMSKEGNSDIRPNFLINFSAN